MTVLVTGATGNIGQHVVQALISAGEQVRAVVRHESRRGAVTDPDAATVVADLNDTGAVDAAVAGVDRVVLIAANSPDQLRQEANVIDAARRAGVQHLVKLSVPGAAEDAPLALARQHWAGEAALRANGVPATVVRPGFFMQNLLQYVSWIAADGSWSLPLGDGAMAMVDGRDVAQVLATLVRADPTGQDPIITGAEALTMSQVADQVSARTGRPVKYVDGDPEEYFRHLLTDGHDEAYARDLTILYDQIIRAGYAATISPDLGTVLHREPLSFAQFVTDHVAAFTPENSEKPAS